jgi:Protein of unknown function (DUF1800)
LLLPTPSAPAAAPTAWLPSPREEQVVSRLSFGWDRRLAHEVARDGVNAWLSRQLAPGSVHDDRAEAMRAWFPLLTWTPKQLWRAFRADRIDIQDLGDDLARWTILRQIHSRRQLLEVMADFWSNLLYIPSPNDKSWMQRVGYDQTIRRHALGRFDTLLTKAILHPAMLLYLDNWMSSAHDANENLGRELLELFTVGTIYTEEDVWDSAMILTGWTVDAKSTWRRRYRPADHFVGRVRVLDFTAGNHDRDGRVVAAAYLRHLAHHPATARRIATRLAVRLVDDDPPPKLVKNVAAAYLASGTDIAATVRSLVHDPLFGAAGFAGSKVRTPIEDYVATTRALGVQALAPSGGSTDKATDKTTDMATVCVWQALSTGQRPFGWPRPDGFPDSAQVWTTATRLLGSWQLHQTLASGTRPSTAVRYRDHAAFMPALPLSFAAFVGEVAARLLHAPADETMVRAAAQATGSSVDDVVTASHRAVKYSFPLLLTALLDSPAHMRR